MEKYSRQGVWHREHATMFTVVARQQTTTEAVACNVWQRTHINQYVNDSTLSILTVSIDITKLYR